MSRWLKAADYLADGEWRTQIEIGKACKSSEGRKIVSEMIAHGYKIDKYDQRWVDEHGQMHWRRLYKLTGAPT